MKIPSMVVFAMDIPKVTGGAVQSPSPFAAAPEAADAVDARRLAGVGLPDGEGGAGGTIDSGQSASAQRRQGMQRDENRLV